jgi:antitoxin HicB
MPDSEVISVGIVKRTFTVVLEPDQEEGGYTAIVPALPGCVTEGDSIDEAMTNAKEAIEGYLEALAKDGKPIPDGRVPTGEVTVEVAV